MVSHENSLVFSDMLSIRESEEFKKLITIAMMQLSRSVKSHNEE